MSDTRTEIFADSHELAWRVADWMAGLIEAHDGPFRLALAGGASPRLLYGELSLRGIRWSKVEFFWIDERFVPHDHPDSNYRMARETLLYHIGARPDQIHSMPTDGDPNEAARRYEADLKAAYGADNLDRGRPLFDFTLLGLGSDGHICSLLPGSPVLEERNHWVAPVAQGRPEVRLTLTYPAVQSSRMTAFLVTGSDKADAVARVRQHDRALPGGRLAPEGDLVWLLDRDAARLI